MKLYPFLNSLRCGAKTKRNSGAPCCSPAVRGKQRCRMHDGAKGSGAQRGNSNALKHGHTTAKAKCFRNAVKSAIKESLKMQAGLDE